MDGQIKENFDPNNDDGHANDDDIFDENDISRVIDVPDDEGRRDDMDADMEEEEGAEGGQEESIEDKAAVVFTAHMDKSHAEDEPPEVYCVHIDPAPSNSGLAVTGGRDDAAYVWVMNSGQVLFQCTGHKNSVTCAAFSHDGSYVASADLDGLVKVWHCTTKKEALSYECGSDITWLQWHHAALVLLAGTQGGEVWMWQIYSEKLKRIKMFHSHGHPSLCGKMLPNGKLVCIGYADGVVKLWDMKTATAVHTWQHASMPEEEMPDENSDDDEGQGDVDKEEAEEESATSPVAILSVDCSADDALVMSGCADSTAKIFNVTSGKLVSAFRCTANADQDNSVESVALCPVLPYAATATNSGTVEIWDLPTSVVRHRLPHPEGVCKVKWSSSAPLLFTACLDGATRLWDARTGDMKAILTGHARNSCILDFDVTKDGTCLVSTSEDGTARVFDLRFTQS